MCIVIIYVYSYIYIYIYIWSVVIDEVGELGVRIVFMQSLAVNLLLFLFLLLFVHY